MKRNHNIDELFYYQSNRLITRPNTTIWTTLCKTIIFIAGVIAISLIINGLINANIEFYNIVLVVAMLSTLVFFKKILILYIELYQHYASEEIRRRCVCQPSCSDYAIMALEKYNVIKAIGLIYKRLRRCYGNELIIDYP